MSFLPSTEKAPEGNYMKLLEGDNTFRVISHAVIGYEYWNKDNKPVRLKTEPQITPADIRVDEGKTSAVKYFWAFVVYSYRAEKRQILELTQASIINPIRNLTKNKQWGDPHDYDITISKTGSGFDTEYSVMPNPKAEFPTGLVSADSVNLEALFTGEDPFAPKMRVDGDKDFIKPEEIPDFLN